ncbi:protein bicaudal D-like [Oppia nitens]|uniref:protein bicaudal D-like n=1 Tax=Oppia nitens TaxID=1686743 RepID=UPI0023DBB637|nr:protein bicaudal D-like [Oppia nitens]
MADPSVAMDLVDSDVNTLKTEISRLNRELAQTSAEKIQSAQYGLVLLDEKEDLQRRYDELELNYETIKKDLEELRDAFTKSQTIHKVSANTGIEREEKLLEETAHKEANFATALHDLERELKQVRHELERVQSEKERYCLDYNEMTKQTELMEWERKNLRTELKELKFRESRLLADNNELEEENISLQKQISSLKSSQIDFETSKHEVRRLQEEMEALQAQLEEYEHLKKIAEKQMEEALEALQSEREQKYAVKKELDKRLNSDSIHNLTNFAGFAGLKFGNELVGDGSEPYDETNSTLEKLEADLMRSPVNSELSPSNTQPSSLEGSLFGEVHLNEIKKLERLLEETENQKIQLNQRLSESQLLLEKSQTEFNNQNKRLLKLFEDINNLVSDYDNIGFDDTVDTNCEFPELSRLKCILNKLLNDSNVSHLRDEVKKLQNKLNSYEVKSSYLEDDLKTMSTIVEDMFANLSLTHDDLITVSEDLAALYHHICLVNGESPNRVMLDHAKPDTDSMLTAIKLEQLKDKLHYPNESLKTIKSLDSNLMDTIRDQLKHLKAAIETSIEQRSSRVKSIPTESTDISVIPSSCEMDDLQDQVLKFKSLLSTKREQIATLRTVLKANKQTAEVALANLKSKYETEKAVVTETMTKLRNELKALKEDAATFASLRSMFAARCEDYVSQIDELQRQYKSSEDEKKTLNSLLRIAIQQKLGLTQKLEELEMDRERVSLGRPSTTGSRLERCSNGSNSTNWRPPNRINRTPPNRGSLRGSTKRGV